MAQKVAVPAAVVQACVRQAKGEIEYEKSKGRTGNASDIQGAVNEAEQIASPKNPGAFVSMSASNAATLAAFGNDPEYNGSMGDMLRHQHFW